MKIYSKIKSKNGKKPVFLVSKRANETNYKKKMLDDYDKMKK